MKRAPITLSISLSTVLLAAPASAADEFAVGPIKTGMTYDEVRAATPGAEWKAMPFRGIQADKAFTLGGLSFGAQYIPEPWDRYHIMAFHASPLTDAASCRANIEKVADAVQSSIGDMEAPPEFSPSVIGYAARQSKVKIGGGSALFIQHIDNTKPESEWLFELSATLHKSDTTVNLNGEARAPRGDKPAQCVIRLTLGEYTRRPRKGKVAFDDLILTAHPSISRLHHSLDGVPLPAQPVAIGLNCEIDDADGGIEDCAASTGIDPAAQPYVKVALERVKDFRVADKTRNGKWTPGEYTSLSLVISADDRRDGLKVDTEKQSLLKFVSYPRQEEMVRFYPRDALEAGAGTELELGCVVQADYSAICPEISVGEGPYAAQFRETASEIVTVYRVAPTLSDGSSAVGAGFRARLKLSP